MVIENWQEVPFSPPVFLKSLKYSFIWFIKDDRDITSFDFMS